MWAIIWLRALRATVHLPPNSMATRSYTVNPASMNFRRTDRIGRYVMLSLSYKLNIMPGK